MKEKNNKGKNNKKENLTDEDSEHLVHGKHPFGNLDLRKEEDWDEPAVSASSTKDEEDEDRFKGNKDWYSGRRKRTNFGKSE